MTRTERRGRFSRPLLAFIVLGYALLTIEALAGASKEVISDTLTVWLAILALACIVAGLYCAWVYRHRREEALFLLRLVLRDVTVSIGAFVGLIYLSLAVSGHGLGMPWGPVVISIPFAISFFWPADDALLWRRERHEYAEAEAAKKRLAELTAEAKQEIRVGENGPEIAQRLDEKGS